MTEAGLHRAVAELLDWALLPPAVWTTFPAGWGKLGKATAGRLHGAGLKAGFPDILCFYNGRCIGIELKTAGGRLSKAQLEMFSVLEKAEVLIHVCHSVEEVLEALRYSNFPVRKLEIAA